MFYNDVAVSSSAYIVSNNRTIINKWIAEEGYGGGRGLIWGTITVFTRLTGETHENRVTITGMQSEILTWNLQTRSKCRTATFVRTCYSMMLCNFRVGRVSSDNPNNNNLGLAWKKCKEVLSVSESHRWLSRAVYVRIPEPAPSISWSAYFALGDIA